MKILAILLLAALPAGLKGCDRAKPPVAPSEACAVIKRTLYPDCRLRFSAAEIDALSVENQKKLTAVKLFFRSCPQAEACRAAQ